MGGILQRANNAFNDWKRNIPCNTGAEMLYGAALHFIPVSLAYQDPISGLTIAGVSAGATLVQAAISPIFAKLQGKEQRPFLMPAVKILMTALALLVVGLPFYGIQKIHLISISIILHSARILLTAFAHRYPKGFIAKILNPLHLDASGNFKQTTWMIVPPLLV